MTGYGRAEGRIGNSLWMVEIRTVNHRFLDIYLKAPRSLSPLELTIKKYLGSQIKRGRVDITIQMGNGGTNSFRPKLNFPLAHEYFQLLQKLREEFSFPEGISLGQFIGLPEIISLEPVEENFNQWEEFRFILDQALISLNEMRENEGKVLQQELQQRIQNIHNALANIENYASQLTNFTREKLLKRFQDLNIPLAIDEPRFLSEIFFLAERSDITEEITRIKSHLAQCAALLELPDAVGRKLEFIFQEINREVTTMSTKANDLRISQAVVEIKSDLEKMREQVQNIE